MIPTLVPELDALIGGARHLSPDVIDSALGELPGGEPRTPWLDALRSLRLEGASVLDLSCALGSPGRAARHAGAAWVDVVQPAADLATVARLLVVRSGATRVFVHEGTEGLRAEYDLVLATGEGLSLLYSLGELSADILLFERRNGDDWAPGGLDLRGEAGGIEIFSRQTSEAVGRLGTAAMGAET